MKSLHACSTCADYYKVLLFNELSAPSVLAVGKLSVSNKPSTKGLIASFSRRRGAQPFRWRQHQLPTTAPLIDRVAVDPEKSV